MYTFIDTPLPKGVAREDVSTDRHTEAVFKDIVGSMQIVDNFTNKLCANRSLKTRWTGTTSFIILTPTQKHNETLVTDDSCASNTLMVMKLHPNAVVPSRGTAGSAGFDLSSVEEATVKLGSRQLIHTGIAVACPSGTYFRIAPRSGLALRHSLGIGAGVVDPDYRGEIMVLLINDGTSPFHVQPGDRVADFLQVD